VIDAPAVEVEVYEASLCKHGEELCGDKIRVLRSPARTVVALSDGLGSGVKANILATLTATIAVTMLRDDVSLTRVIETIAETLPVCRVRHVAYATLSVVEVEPSGRFRIVNFDNPAPFFFRAGKPRSIPWRQITVHDRLMNIAEGTMRRGDFVGLISDGVVHAGVGARLNLGWGWDNVARHLEGAFIRGPHTARDVVRSVMNRTADLYAGEPGDDATFAGLYVRSAVT
jgi:hypothetical protein